jgi:hypothetical protein
MTSDQSQQAARKESPPLIDKVFAAEQDHNGGGFQKPPETISFNEKR